MRRNIIERVAAVLATYFRGVEKHQADIRYEADRLKNPDDFILVNGKYLAKRG